MTDELNSLMLSSKLGRIVRFGFEALEKKSVGKMNLSISYSNDIYLEVRKHLQNYIV